MIKETRHSQCLCSKHAYLDAIANADDDNYVHSTCYGMPESITRWYTRRPDVFSCIHSVLLPVCRKRWGNCGSGHGSSEYFQKNTDRKAVYYYVIFI